LQLDVQHSLIEYVEGKLNIPTLWHYDGVQLADAGGKPFITVKQMVNSTEILSKGREAVQTTFAFEVGLYTESARERAKLQDELHRLFIFDRIPLLNAETGEQRGVLTVDAPFITPIDADELNVKTNYHRVYFDVEIRVTYNAKTY